MTNLGFFLKNNTLEENLRKTSWCDMLVLSRAAMFFALLISEMNLIKKNCVSKKGLLQIEECIQIVVKHLVLFLKCEII